MNNENSSSRNAGFLPAIFPRVTSHMVWSRTVELAVNAGRNPIEVRRADFQQAKCELTGETDFDRQAQCFSMDGTTPYWPVERNPAPI
jgi:hypothetical protein